jgi:hypothetical protein
MKFYSTMLYFAKKGNDTEFLQPASVPCCERKLCKKDLTYVCKIVKPAQTKLTTCNILRPTMIHDIGCKC